MNAIDLMASLDCVPEEYIQEAFSWQKAQHHRRPPLLLVAAIAALAAILAGCTVAYLLNLKDLQVGTYRYTHSRYVDTDGNQVAETEVVRDWLSLQGIVGTPQLSGRPGMA